MRTFMWIFLFGSFEVYLSCPFAALERSNDFMASFWLVDFEWKVWMVLNNSNVPKRLSISSKWLNGTKRFLMAWMALNGTRSKTVSNWSQQLISMITRFSTLLSQPISPQISSRQFPRRPSRPLERLRIGIRISLTLERLFMAVQVKVLWMASGLAWK